MGATFTICKNVVGIQSESRKVGKSGRKRIVLTKKCLSDLCGLPDLCGLFQPN